MFGQEFRSDIQGNVTDQTGLPVLNAQVRAINEETGLQASAVSSEAGEYRLLRLAPGRYRLEVTMAGFKTWIRQQIALEVATKLRLDVRLELGDVQQQVVVTSAAPMVNSVEANMDQVVREREIADLPLNGRNAYSLLALSADVQPGVPGSFADTLPREIGNRSNFQISGTPQRTAEVLLDGVPTTAGKLVVYTPSPDVVKEFKVQTPFDAEYGYSLGGMVNAVTKSGTNEYHGSLWEFLRNDVLQANGFFSNRAGVAKTAFRFNQFGFAAGGPIVKNRAFFFGSYEGIRERTPDRFIASLPTAGQRAGDFSQTRASNGQMIVIYNPFSSRAAGAGFIRDPFPDNRIPASLIDPVGQKLIGYYPQPNSPGDPVTGANNFATAGPAQENYNTFQTRIDYDISAKHRIFGRHSAGIPRSVPFNPYGNDALPDWYRNMYNQSLSLDYTGTYSPSLLFDLRLGFSRASNDAGPPLGFDATKLGLPSALVSQMRSHYFPRVDVGDAPQLGPPSGGQWIADNAYSLHGGLSKIKGPHNLKFGADLRFNQGNQFLGSNSGGLFSFSRGFTQGPDPLKASVTAGYGVASLLLGTGSGSVDIQEPMSIGVFSTALYINDTWSVTPRLSLTLGLRYENYGPLTERYNRYTRGFQWDQPNPLEARAQAAYAAKPIPELSQLRVRGGLLFAGVQGVPRGLTDRDNNNFAPRLGLAYSFNSATVFRAGYGISYSQLDSIIPRNVIVAEQTGFSETTPWVGSIDGITPYNLLRNPIPSGLIQPAGSRLGLLAGVGRGISVFDPKPRTSYVQTYEASIQRQVASNLLLEVAYLGNVVQRLQVAHPGDALPGSYLALGSRLNNTVANPFLGLIDSGTLSTPTVTVQQLLLPYPEYTSISSRELIGRTWYHSMRLKLEKRFSHGLSLLASYRISKLMDRTDFLNGSDSAPSPVIDATDSPQRFVLSGTWELPMGPGKPVSSSNPLVRQLISGWQLNGIVTLNRGFPLSGFANAVSTGRSPRLDSPTVDRWFDTTAFTVQAPFTLRALSSRLPDVRAATYRNADISLFKLTRIRERYSLQFRAEFFNASNTPLFGAPDTNIRSRTFGQVNNQANDPREIQFGLKLLF